MPGTIHVEKIGHHVSLLTIDNPPANAMDAAMLGKLLEEFQAINDASSARAIILTGSGNSFCAGVNMGLMASAYRLPRLIGVARAKAMLLTGSAFDALAVERFGVTTQTEPPAALLIAAKNLATRIASRAPLSVEATKRVASRAMDLDPTAMRELEKQELPSLRNSNDHQEAVKAFREKREPIFTRS